MGEDDAQNVTSDAEVVQSTLNSEFAVFMGLPKAQKLLKQQDVDALLLEFASFLSWSHATLEASPS
jgi:hypothetical protein